MLDPFLESLLLYPFDPPAEPENKGNNNYNSRKDANEINMFSAAVSIP